MKEKTFRFAAYYYVLTHRRDNNKIITIPSMFVRKKYKCKPSPWPKAGTAKVYIKRKPDKYLKISALP